MIPHVTIIALLFFFTSAASAIPRYQPPQKRTKCERSLVSDSVVSQVQDLGVEIAELIGKLKIKAEQSDSSLSPAQIDRFAKNLYEMYGRVAEIRANFTVAGADLTGLIEGLEEQMSTQLPEIKAALNPTATKSIPPPAAPQKFMKREVFGFDPALADWSADEVSDYLRQPHAPMEPKQQQQAKPQVLGPRPVVQGPEGYRPHGLWEKP